MLASASPITKSKQLSSKQREIFDALFSSGSSILLLEYQLVLACHRDPDLRRRIAMFYAQAYIGAIQKVLSNPSNKNLPKLDVAAVLRAKENGEPVPVCLERVFQGFDLPAIANQLRFWTFLTEYLQGVLLAHPDIAILKTAFDYVIEAAVANRMTAEDVREYGLRIRHSSLALNWLLMNQTVAAELAPLSLRPGALNVAALRQYGVELCVQYVRVSVSANRMLALLRVLVNRLCSPLVFVLALGLAHYQNALTVNNAALLFLGMFVVSLLATKCLPDPHIVNSPQGVAANLARLAELFKFVPVKFIHERTLVTTHETAIAVNHRSAAVDLSALFALSQSSVAPPVPSVVEDVVALPSVESGIIHAQSKTLKVDRREKMPVPRVVVPMPPVLPAGVVVVDALRKFYARIDTDALSEQRVPPVVIAAFTNALKPGSLLSARSKGDAGVKLIDPSNPVRTRGQAMTAKLKIVGASAHGARLFSHLVLEGGFPIHVFATFVEGNRAHRF